MIDLRKMKISILVLLAAGALFIFCTSRIFSQNILINGSFEAAGPIGPIGVDGNFWYLSGADVPMNALGNENPCDGSAYACIHQTTTTPSVFSWAAFQLTQTINTGDSVVVSMCLSLAEYGMFKTNTLSGIFGDVSLTLGNEPNLTVPMVEFQSILADTSGWVTVTDTFISSGNFDYFSLYFFNDFGSIALANPSGNSSGAYYFIDNLVVKKKNPAGIADQAGNAANQIINMYGKQVLESESGLQFRISQSANGSYTTKKVFVVTD